MRKIAVVAAAVVGLTVGATSLQPASAAAPVSWTDPADDATIQAPLPSEPSLDILRSDASSDGTKLTWTIGVKELADMPPGSVGYSFRYHFTYAGVGYFFDVNENAVLGNGTYFTLEAGDPTATLGCAGCVGRIDRTKRTVMLTVPLTTLKAGVKVGSPSAKPLGPGSKLEDLVVDSWRDEVLIVLLADEAAAPESTALTL